MKPSPHSSAKRIPRRNLGSLMVLSVLTVPGLLADAAEASGSAESRFHLLSPQTKSRLLDSVRCSPPSEITERSQDFTLFSSAPERCPDPTLGGRRFPGGARDLLSFTGWSPMGLETTALLRVAGGAPASRPYPRLTGPMNKSSWIATGVISGAAVGWAFAHTDRGSEDDRHAIETPGDMLQGMPLVTIPYSWAIGDKQGRNQGFLAAGLMQATVGVLKNLSEKWRPNASSQTSWPSGHTAGAFTGAAYIHTRYGPKLALPLYALASYTAYSRVFAQKHFADDVLSGMSVGILSNLLITRPVEEDRRARWLDQERRRPWRFEWEFGAAFQPTNRVTAPRDGGTQFDPELTGESDPTTTARVSIDWTSKKGHEIGFMGAPLEVRDIGQFGYEVTFQGETFAADDTVVTLFLLYDWRLRYRYALIDNERIRFKLGAALSLHDSEVDVVREDELDDQIEYDPALDLRMLPLASLHFGVNLSRKLELFFDGAATSLSGVDFYEAEANLRYRFNSLWDLAVGYRRTRRDLDDPALVNELVWDGASMSVGYSF